MINVNKITSTLAKLSDLQLQTYAKMNPDPYTIALAVAESNRRKEMRSAGQGAQGMQEQPKVVDQMVAEMAPQQLPEDQGIGQLPAGNMNFAGGGIIAFADGGDVERYQYGGMPPRSIMGDIPGFVAGTGNLIPQQGAPEEVPLFRRMFRDARAVGANYQLEQAKARIAAGVGTSADEAIIAAAQPAQSTAPSPQDMAQFDAASNLYMTERAAKQAAAPKAADAAPKVDPTRRVGPGAGPAAAAAGPKAASADQETAGLDSLINRFTRQSDLATGAAKNARAELAAKTEQIPKDRAERNRKELEAEGDVYKSREDRLAAREKGLEGMGDKYLGLALLQAGAAMMSTPGALGAVLGKGIQVGSERYVAGIDKINAAKEKFADARERLDDLRLNRSDMTKKQIRDDQREIDNAQIQAKKLLSDGLDNDLKISNDNQKAIFGVVASSLETDKRIASTEKIAAIGENRADARANAYTPDMREAMLLGTGNTPEEKYLSGLKVKKELTGDKQGLQMLKLFLEENGRREKNMEKPLTLEQFRRQSSAFFAPPAAVDTGKPDRS
jgi:hypothetical protein